MRICVLLLLFFLPVSSAYAEDIFLREDFESIHRWSPFAFQSIERKSEYTLARLDGMGVLKAVSDASASGIVLKDLVPIHDFPRLRWRWKIVNIYEKGDATTKKGDDFPLRICILIPFDPEDAGFFEKIKFNLYKKSRGEYPPRAALHYVWANKPFPEQVMGNPRLDDLKMIAKQSGTARLGEWIEEEADVLGDYTAAFGEAPPKHIRIAVMNDSDDTGEASTAFLDFLEFRK